jgi:hypothetical protein
MSHLEDTLLEERDNRLGHSRSNLRPSSLIITEATHLTSPATVEVLTLELPQLTQDGGKCSEWKVNSLLTFEIERSWMSQETEIKKDKTFTCGRNTVDSTNNGILSMLTNGRENQRRVNSTKSTDSMFKDHSTLLPT